MNINDLARQTEATTGGFRKHPLGTFTGEVTGLAQKEINGKVAYELEITTGHGTVNSLIWEISEAEAMQAAADINLRERIMKAIARTKRLFVDLGVWSQDEANGASWNDPSGTSVIGSLAKLGRCKCQVVVEANNRDASKQVVFVNAPSNEPDQVRQTVSQVAPPSVGAVPPQAGNMVVPPPSGNAFPQAPGTQPGVPVPDMSNIPF